MNKLIQALKSITPRRFIKVYHWIKAVVAIAWYRYPARQAIVIGVTGTDGKTTTSHIIYKILRAADLPASLITTTGAIIYGQENQPLGLHVTTPNPFELQLFIKNAIKSGSKYIVLETTSHGLAQHRVLGCNFHVGVVTNITPEHLDYHGTYEQYLKDKSKLFRNVKASILNMDDGSYEKLRLLANGRIFTYSMNKQSDITANNISYGINGTVFSIPQIDKTIHSRFLGDYNVQNMLGATAVAIVLGIDSDAIAIGLEQAVPPPGRLEKVTKNENFTVFVDFAHTPNSIENMLKLLRRIATQKLIVVFGCAGDRDRGKRFPMGASAGRYCDYTVITAEDPRTENLEKIIDDVAAGCEMEGGILGKTYFRIPDRQEAISFAVQELAKPGDIVVSTGKAHEQSMCFGDIEYPWDEFAAVRKALAGYKDSSLPTGIKEV